MDEHSPYWKKPEENDGYLDLREMVKNRLFLFLVAFLLLLPLIGCEDFDRRLAEQEFREKVFNACLPEEGERKIVIRDKGAIHFTTIDLSAGRYGPKFPHTEIRVATIEDSQ